LLGGPVQIHLRGSVGRSVRQALEALAQECGIGERLFFHAQVSPAELLSRTAEHDVGLALEQGQTLNRAICTTNKLFFYMLAGIAVVATDVPGHSSILNQSPGAAVAYTPGDYRALASHLERWRMNRAALDGAKE